MEPTSDERREVAERVRKTHGIMAFVDALGIDVDSDWCWTDVSRRVAELIDQTCEVVVDEPDGGAGEFVAQMIGTVCSRCGGDMPRDRFTGAYPDYCPRCGARVVGSEGSVTR